MGFFFGGGGGGRGKVKRFVTPEYGLGGYTHSSDLVNIKSTLTQFSLDINR